MVCFKLARATPCPPHSACLCSPSLAVIVSSLARLIVSPRAAKYPQGHAAGVRDEPGREQARRAPRLASRRGATRRSLVPRRVSRLPPKSKFAHTCVALLSLVRPRPSLAFSSGDRSLETAGASSVPAALKGRNVAYAHAPGQLWRHDAGDPTRLFIFTSQSDLSQVQFRAES